MKRLFAGILALCFATAAYAQDKPKVIIATGVDPSLATFYVASSGGFFTKNGLDVQLNTGASGSAMVGFLVKNQIQAVLAAEQAGIQSYNVDPDVVVAAEMLQMPRYLGLLARNIDTMDGLKGKKVGVALGSASEVFWRALVEKLALNVNDYKVVPVELPEMVAAIERGDIDAFSGWEPWMSRAMQAVPNTKILRDNFGIITTRNFLYMNRSWAEANKPAADAVMKSLVEATAFMQSNPAEAARLVATFLKLDPQFTQMLMAKCDFKIQFDQSSLDHLKNVESQLKAAGKLKKPVEWANFVYLDPLKRVAADSVRVDKVQ